jgi:hypothetical protein
MSRMSIVERVVLAGTVAGAAGFALVGTPAPIGVALALLFLAAVAFVLAAVIDRRTPPVVIDPKPEVAP